MNHPRPPAESAGASPEPSPGHSKLGANAPGSPIGDVLIGLFAYSCWGLMPLLLRALRPVSAENLLCFRIVASLPVLFGLLLLRKRLTHLLAIARRPRVMVTLFASAAIIGANWLLYIYGVHANQVVEVSLAYFIIPFLGAGLGRIFLNERLDAAARGSILLAACGVGLIVLEHGGIPFVTWALAVTFVAYTFVRKTVPAEALDGMVVETLLLFPLALGWLIVTGGFSLPASGPSLLVLMCATGAMAIPMLLFIVAAKRMRLSDLGFLQYVSPTIQLGLALLVFREPIDMVQLGAFLLIWTAIVIYGWSRMRRGQHPTAVE